MDYQQFKALEDRMIRIETILCKLAAHIGMNPYTGAQLRDATTNPGPVRAPKRDEYGA